MSTNTDREELHEHVVGGVKCQISRDAEQVAARVAKRVAEIIREKDSRGEPTVLGLATGSTPVLVYKELIRLHREEGLSFQNVHSFNLDEYYGLTKDHPESYYDYMRLQLFSHIDIPKDQAHVPDGMSSRTTVADDCLSYEEKITALGGLDFQLLGIGRTGHIGFNEPGSSSSSRTRLVTLDPLTRLDAARDFVGLENVPRAAITMGVGTILEAREITLLAWGKGKAKVIRKALEEKATESLPASLLRGHPHLVFALNSMAASELTCIREPWTEGPIQWTEAMIKKGVHYLAQKVDKPILKLVDRDYQLNGLEELLSLHGPAYDLNIRVFKKTQTTITGWPGGKPHADDRLRPVPSSPASKRIVVLASEPGAEFPALGGTINLLQKQGHQVNLVYLTSGHLTVSQAEVKKFTSLLELLASQPAIIGNNEPLGLHLKELATNISSENGAQKTARSLIRVHQSKLAQEALSLPQDARYLNLPFYETGAYRKFKPSDEDRSILADVLNEIKPHQIYVSGKMADPSSLEGVCWQLFEQTQNLWTDWKEDNQIWLFREKGDDWESHDIDMAVPVSPDERSLKEAAISEYPVEVSEKDSTEAQTVATTYDALGLPEYEEIEAFQRHLLE